MKFGVSILCLWPLLLGVQNIHGLEMRRLLLLDFNNVDKDQNYQYLEVSITDAIRDLLKQKFEFKDTPREDASKFADANLLMSDEFHTKSVAFQMGLLMKQDIVINGAFHIKDDVIFTKAQIFDIGNRRMIKTFEVSGPASSQLFVSINKIAERIAEECASVLPNKDEWQRTVQAEEKADPLRLNRVEIRGGFSMLTLPSQSTSPLTENTILRPADIPGTAAISLGYARENIYWDSFAWGEFGYQFGSNKFSVDKNAQQISASLSFIMARGGIGRTFPIYRNFSIAPLIGIGYYFGSLKLDYGSLPSKPLDSNGNEVADRKIGVSAPSMIVGGRMNYLINRSLDAHIQTEYSHVLYANGSSGFLQLAAGLSFRM